MVEFIISVVKVGAPAYNCSSFQYAPIYQVISAGLYIFVPVLGIICNATKCTIYIVAMVYVVFMFFVKIGNIIVMAIVPSGLTGYCYMNPMFPIEGICLASINLTILLIYMFILCKQKSYNDSLNVTSMLDTQNSARTRQTELGEVLYSKNVEVPMG
jgi:hypothetical protein